MNSGPARWAVAHLGAWTWLIAEHRTWLIVIATVIGIAAPLLSAARKNRPRPATLEQATWQNTQIAGPYDAAVIRQLKERVPGGIYVSGSGTLVRAMLADGLVDELHLFVYPLTLGAGPRLFDRTPDGKFALANSQAYDNGVLYLHYDVAA